MLGRISQERQSGSDLENWTELDVKDIEVVLSAIVAPWNPYSRRKMRPRKVVANLHDEMRSL
jgi:hypothetical protein